MKVKEKSEKVGLKFSTQKTKIMASCPITSWEIDGETVETVSDFILGGSQITADGDCSHEIKRCLFLGRKVTPNLDSILKSRDIPLPAKVHLVKAMVFPVVMYGWLWQGRSYSHSISVSSVAQSCPTLWPHESQYARPPCPSPTPGVHSDSSPSSRWCTLYEILNSVYAIQNTLVASLFYS